MARKSATKIIENDNVDNDGLTRASNALVSMSGNAAQVAGLIGYDLPYERELVIQMFNFHASNAAESMLQMGRHLILLKENEPHGEFMEIVSDRLGLNIRTAQKMMQAAVKFMGLSPKTNASLGAGLSKSKLFLLMTEDDDTLEALAEGGTLLGLTLDDIQRMTKAEMEVALREARQAVKDKDDYISKKTKEYQEKDAKKSRLKPLTPDEEGKALLNETSAAVYEAEGMIRGVIRDGLQKLAQHAAEHDGSFEEVSSGMLNQLTRCIKELHSTLGIKEVANGDPVPAWAK